MTSSVWLIHKRLRGDTSVDLRFFTADKGMLECAFKGGRKKQTLLESFTPFWLDSVARYAHHYVRSLEVQGPGYYLTGTHLLVGLYINELLYHALPLQEPHPHLFLAYSQLLPQLAAPLDSVNLEILLRQFEWILLKECGYQLQEASFQYLKGDVSERSAIIAGDFSDINQLKLAKRVMRHALHELLEGRELQTRKLFL